MSSASRRRRRRHPRASPPAQRHLRVAPLDATTERFVVTAILQVDELGNEETAQLYRAVCGLGPSVADIDDDRLIAHFVRYAPNVEVAAWTVVDEVRALPQVRLIQVEAGRVNRERPDLVLTTGVLTELAWRRRAA